VKTMVVGSRGMLGTELMQALAPHAPLGLDQPELDITDSRACEARVCEFCPDVIINAAALTDVDYCEWHEAEALRVNGEGAGNLAAAARTVGAVIVYYSTDYVFDGIRDTGYLEEDAPNPLSVYGRSKLQGEERVRSLCPDHMILRTSWLFGRHGRNFISTIVNAARNGQALRIVNDQRGSPTYAVDLAARTRALVESGCRGTYHVTNNGTCTWYELALRSVECAHLAGTRLEPVSSSQFPRPAPRPAFSMLTNARMLREGFPPLRPWPEAVQDYVYSCLSAG